MQEDKGKKIEEKLNSLQLQLIEITKCPVEKEAVLDRALRFFKTEFKQRWSAACRKDRFMKNNEKWLVASIELPFFEKKTIQKAGRPTKFFQDLSESSKRRKTQELREQVPANELLYAASISQRTSDNTDASVVLKELMSTPTRAKKYRKAFKSSEKQVSVRKHSPQEALAIFVEGDFTRRQWEILHGANKNIYPCYSLLQKAKKECYPEEIIVTETHIGVQLQSLLDHTSSRLYKYLAEVIETCTKSERENLELILKWGCDGSQQSQYKQKFQDVSNNDGNIFQSSLVPLRLIVTTTNGDTKIIWQNPVPSSIRFCRPIRIRFVSETKDITKEEIAYIHNQANSLEKTILQTNDGIVKIKYTMLLTMVDGKVCNAATDTASTMRCYICGQTAKDFNKLLNVEEINVEALQFGLSILHARIRFFESLLHLVYKLPLKKWQARTQAEKDIVKERKATIQKMFREEMGLLVDVPKAGFGNTNDDNTSRRFFADPDTSARITGIDINLITRFRVILEVISSGMSINIPKFSEYAKNTATMYVQLYGWCPMTPTIHKVLMHGANVISHAILPIGQLSEKAAEARNKTFRQYRLGFSRKFSREQCNRDILNRLLLTSDPYLSSIRPKHQKKRKPFSKEALDLMVAIDPPYSYISIVHQELDDESSDENLVEDIDQDFDYED